ncbi:phosphoribosylglycinamide formyltransferase [Geothrix sp. PMB-07]|uniref:phosphoribosylglycinamide formyltransferase n=1 Tax=Geothrix sp. PMB-07 TaxID=3068640 RepID=UPI0027413846|nr:phosphoribosylglycinamide formyltransferase [Geothrix sp. PMB-07]WLT33322.1 phosphoribosylglycinamide formyltransferase [Geothrix sp. PMB-07]
MKRLAFFISGSGGNALNLVRACREGRIPGQPVLGLASTAKAEGIARLEAEGLPVAVVVRKDFDSDEAFSAACYLAAEKAGAEVICLCGWLKKLAVPAHWEGRILNIHPGLLPQYGGPGMFGMHVHRAVLAAGETESGATVHLVDGEYDHGRILDQQRVPVLPGDAPEDLQQRVYAAEMELFPRALAAYLSDRI